MLLGIASEIIGAYLVRSSFDFASLGGYGGFLVCFFGWRGGIAFFCLVLVFCSLVSANMSF